MFLSTKLVSNRLKLIKLSPTVSLAAKANILRAKGKDIINLGVGEPDFDTPENIKQAAYHAIKSGKTKYTAVDGIPRLKHAIISKFYKENKLSYSLENITVGCGAKHVIYNIIAAIINYGDEVIIPAPYWVSYPDMVSINGGKAIIVKTSQDNNFKLTPQILKSTITAKTKLLIINSPSNPSGTCYSEEELKLLANVLNDYPYIHVISDDIYEHILYHSGNYRNIANVSDTMKERTFVVNGVSKSYSMTGWRIGYAAGNQSIIKAIAKIQSQITSNPCSISQYAAIEALSDNSRQHIQKSKILFKERRDLVIKKLCNTAGINFVCYPEGAFYFFLECKELIGSRSRSGKIIKNCTDFAQYLLEEYSVMVVPGVAFGVENFFRISYAMSDIEIISACDRIKEGCNNLKPRAAC